MSGATFTTLEELGEGDGCRKVRGALSITVVLVVGGKNGSVERDGHLVDPERDLERRKSFGASG